MPGFFQRTANNPGQVVYQNWRNGFLHFLELGEAVPETEMFAFELFPWMAGYSFSQVLIGSFNHHEEHREHLQEWFKAHGNEIASHNL